MASLILARLVRKIYQNPQGVEIYLKDAQAAEVYQALDNGEAIIRNGQGTFTFETDYESEAFLIRNFDTGGIITYKVVGYEDYFQVFWDRGGRFVRINWNISSGPRKLDPFDLEVVDTGSGSTPIPTPPPPGPAETVVPKIEYRSVTNLEFTLKKLVLVSDPLNSSDVVVDIIGGGPQQFGVDYTVSARDVIWDGYGLEPFIAQGDVLRITYYVPA